MIGFLCFILIGFFKGLADLSAEGRIFPKAESSKNKWKLDEKGNTIPEGRSYWYYAWVYIPEHKERRPLSSTWLVWTTDFWHRTQTARFISTVGAVIGYTEVVFHPVIDLCIFPLCYVAGFTPVYEVVKRNLFNFTTILNKKKPENNV